MKGKRMFRQGAQLCAAIFCAAIHGNSSLAETSPRTDQPIVNGLASSDYPTVGALLFSPTGSAQNAVGICSGTLAGCRTFITAAHCVCETVGPNCQPGAAGAPNPRQYFVYLPHVGVVPVEAIAVREDFDFPTGDIAVVRLQSAVENIRPSPINNVASPPGGTSGVIVGYGLTGGGKSDYGLKRYGNVVTTACSGGISPQTSVCWAFRAPLGPPATNSNTCNGDSGGPLFVDFGSGLLLAGVTSGGTSETCGPPDDSYDANVYNYRTWIEAQAGTDLNSSACGTGPQVGDPEVSVLAYTGSLNGGDAIVYEFEVPPFTTELRVTSNATRDFDLYVLDGPGVSRSNYTCKDEGASPMAACRFDSPESGSWSAMVYAFGGSGTFQITMTMIGASCVGKPDGTPCDDANDCTEADQCLSGSCVGSPRTDGSPCSDGNRCTNPDQCVSGVCVGASHPRTDCKRVTLMGSSVLRIGRPFDRPPSLVWRWSQGESTDVSLFGDPRGATDFDVCLYQDQGGQPTLSWQKNISAGGFCYGGRACWVRTRTGFRYANRNGAATGITRLQLMSGVEGRASITLKAGTVNFSAPTLPLSLPAKVQLMNDYACWEANFPSAAKNNSTQLRARGTP